jgi:hypothetical protein
MNIFLSTPISCFKNSQELGAYKAGIFKLINALRTRYTLCAEIERIDNSSDFDSPQKSLDADLGAIRDCDLFLMHYPKCNPTSALIELGMAIAEQKRILIITTNKNELPYLARELGLAREYAEVVEQAAIDDECIDMAFRLIDKLALINPNNS